MITRKIIIVYKPTRECLEKAKKITTLCRDKGLEIELYSADDIVYEKIVKPDIVIAIGGDGTLLKISRTYQQYTPLILPIPCGRRTVLYEPIREEQYGEVIDRIINSTYRIQLLRRIKTSIRENEYLVLNEILMVSIDRGRVTGFYIDIQNPIFTSSFSFDGDGVLIGPPIGSAAYNLSARGPLIDYSLEALFITPLNPMELNITPIIVNPLTKIKVKSRGYTEIYIDGERKEYIKPYTEVNIELSNKNLRIIRIYEKDYIRDVYFKRRMYYEPQ